MNAKNRLVSYINKIVIIILMIFFIAIPGSNADPTISVTPETIRLGVAKIAETDIKFQGKGFTPGDSVFIKILDVQKDGKRIDIPIANSRIDPDGRFETEMDILVKVAELLRADIGMDDNFENIIIVKNKPIAPGLYTIKAISMETDKTAECKLKIKEPSVFDRLKDWIGGLLGKIKKES